jgi:hypothetical protein
MASYAARVLEGQHGPPCDDVELARAFMLANASLQCPLSSARALTPLCENAAFLTPAMHGVVVAAMTLGVAQCAWLALAL